MSEIEKRINEQVQAQNKAPEVLYSPEQVKRLYKRYLEKIQVFRKGTKVQLIMYLDFQNEQVAKDYVKAVVKEYG